MQEAPGVFLIRPAFFAYNAETAITNSFQKNSGTLNISEKARAEFDNLVLALRGAGVHTLVFEDTPVPKKPDAVFPNNWISTHHDGTVILYPMQAASRRTERRSDIVTALEKNFRVSRSEDLSGYEKENIFLEGTGSVVFDHKNKIAYACLSPRTNRVALERLCRILQYRPVLFSAFDNNGFSVYHTNVMLSVAENFSVICSESVVNTAERKNVIDHLLSGRKEIINISQQQMACFAGNMLALKDSGGNTVLALSRSAFDSLSDEQKSSLSRYATLLPLFIPTIEGAGGGSVRCMLAEIFLPPR